MLDTPHTRAVTLTRAREIARTAGLLYVYTGNVHDEAGGGTYCPGCGARVIGRDWYEITAWNLVRGCCGCCGPAIAGVFEPRPGAWGPRRTRGGRRCASHRWPRPADRCSHARSPGTARARRRCSPTAADDRDDFAARVRPAGHRPDGSLQSPYVCAARRLFFEGIKSRQGGAQPSSKSAAAR